MKRSRGYTLIELLCTIGAILIVFGGLIPITGWFVLEDSAVEAARVAGFRDITVGERSVLFVGMRGCSGEDTVRFTVRATNQNDEKVEFYVCSALFFKGSTIRTK